MNIPYAEELRGEVGKLIIAWLLTNLSTGVIYFSLSYYVPKVLGFPAWVMGVMITTAGVITVALSWPFGYISDKYGRRRTFLVGTLLSSIAIFLLAYAKTVGELILVSVISGFSGAMLGASYNALLTDKTDMESRTRAFSLSFSVGVFGMASGGFLLYLTSPLESLTGSSLMAHRMLFTFMAILALGSPLLSLSISKDKGLDKRVPLILPKRSSHVLVPFLIASSLIALGAGMVVPLMPFWFSLKFLVGDSISGPVLGLSMLLTGISNLFAPRLSSKFGHVRAIVLSQGFSTIFLFLLPFSPMFALAGLLYIIRTVTMNMANPLQTSFIMSLVNKQERGLASGLSSAFWRLPHSLSSYLGAYLMGEKLIDLPFYICTLLYMISISYFWMKFKDVRIRKEEIAFIPTEA